MNNIVITDKSSKPALIINNNMNLYLLVSIHEYSGDYMLLEIMYNL